MSFFAISLYIFKLTDAFRYMFKSTERVALQEIGPRFTLKLRYIKKGIPAVHQLGAAPPPLEFDNEDSDEQENAPMKHLGDQVGESEDDDNENLSSLSRPTLPNKDEEYIWQWKVRDTSIRQINFPDPLSRLQADLETSRKTFFL